MCGFSSQFRCHNAGRHGNNPVTDNHDNCRQGLAQVRSRGNALPLAWRVRHSPKGHCPEALHIAVVALMSTVTPEGATVVLLGDGEFDGTALQDTLSAVGWSYVCRTATSTTATWEGEPFRLDALGTCIKPGRLKALVKRQYVSPTQRLTAFFPLRFAGYTPPVLRKNSLLPTSASPAYPALSLMVRCRFYGSIVDKTGHPIPCHKMPKILGTSLTM
jgi:hypothetical protein